jgi:hypothetical protein
MPPLYCITYAEVNNGAILLNKSLEQKIFIPFNESSEETGIVKDGDKCKFLSRKGSFEKNDAAFIDHDGKYLWKYSKKKRYTDYTAVGDLNGDGKLEFAIGFNGGDGIHLLDEAGNKVWGKPDGNVWHVEMVDTDNDGHLKIVHSNAAGSITIRDKNGDIISKNTPTQHLTHFSIVNWPDIKSNKRIMLAEDKTIWLLDFNGKTIAKYDAPNCHNLGDARGTLVRLLKNQAEYFAVTVEYKLWNRTILYVYDSESELVYQENLPDRCSSIAAMHNDSNTESLLVGCTNYVLKFDVSKTN